MHKRIAIVGLALGLALIAPGPATAQVFEACAREGDYCSVPYPTTVYFGVYGRTTSLQVGRRGVWCSREIFGDPAPGRVKYCTFQLREDHGYRWHGPRRY